MATLFRGGWTDRYFRNVLASFAITLLFLVTVSPSTAEVVQVR